MTAVRKAETAHSTSTSEVEAACTTTVRKAEAASVAQASKLQQTHQETMQNLKDEALEVEKHPCQSFLQACGVALQACPNEALGKLMYPIHLLTGNMSLTGPLMATSPLIIRWQDPICSPATPGGLQLLHTLPGLSGNTCLDVRQNQIMPEMENLHPTLESHPNKDGGRKSLLQSIWGVLARRPSTNFQTWLSA